MRKALALVSLAAVSGFAVQIALASEGQNTTAEAQTPSVVPTQSDCVPLKVVFARKNWRDSHPARGVNACPGPVRKYRDAFRLYRHYREIAPFKCLGGDEGYFAIPCYIIECESHFNWWAMNSSGASYVYQLLGWGAPPPTTFRNRVRNHEIAASLSLSNWSCA